MDGKESPRKCLNCGVPLLPQAKFCTQCGTKLEVERPREEDLRQFISCPSCSKKMDVGAKSCPYCGTRLRERETHPPPEYKRLGKEQEPVQEQIKEPLTPQPSQFVTTLDQGLKLVNLLRKNISTVIVVVGILSIVAAIAFTIIVLLPPDLVSDIEIPPLEGMIFDLFLIIGLLAILSKELVVYLGYIPKKETLDRWFSFGLILIFWTNLITFSIGLVEESLFFRLGMDLPLVFLFLSLINFLLGLLYFRRYREPIFSSTFIIIIMSIEYLLPWLLIPVDPIAYTILIYLTTFGVILISRQAKDLIPFIGLTVLLPLMFLSPYLLSNSTIPTIIPIYDKALSVTLIVILLVSFPFLEILLRQITVRKPDRKDLALNSLGEFCSTFGMLNVGFSVFYGHLDPGLSVFLLAIPVLGFLGLKIKNTDFQRLPIRDLSTSIFLLFTVVFFDFILNDLLILFGIAVILTLYTTFTFFEYSTFKTHQFKRYSELLLLASLVTISLSNLDFIWKVGLIAIPMLKFLYFIQQKKPINQFTIRGFVFGSIIILLLAFIRSPTFDVVVILGLSIIAVIGLLILIIYYKKDNLAEYSLDLTIFTLIFEITILAIALWTKSITEMLFPVILLSILAILISLTQVRRKITQNVSWLNSTFLVCFGLMAYWNEFDEPMLTVLIASLLTIPILLERLFTKDIQASQVVDALFKNHNLNISLSAIGLALVLFFEEFDPISHSLLLLIIPLLWMALYLFQTHNYNALSVLSITIFPGIIFTFEMLLKETIFTPITDIMYLYLSLLALTFPVITLQMEHFLRKRTQRTVNPFIIGTILASFILLIAFWVYDFQTVMVWDFEFQSTSLLLLGLILALIVSLFLIKWQYESVLLLLVSFLPSTLYASYLDLPILTTYLLPILPILVNLLMAHKYLRTDLSVQIHEFLILAYFGLFILFSPIKIIEYITALAALFLISWQLIGLLKGKVDHLWFSLTNLLNSTFILVAIVLIAPLVPESFKDAPLIVLILLILIIATVLLLVSWQIGKISDTTSIIMTITLIINCSSFILSMTPLMTITTEIILDTITIGTLLASSILLMFSMFSYVKITKVKQEISLACIYTTAIWVLLSSSYFTNIELVFLWIFFAPLLIMIYLAKQEKSIILLGIIFYIVAGLRLIENTLEFLLFGQPEWITIFGLIVLGIELVSFGIYSSLTKKPQETTE